MKSPVGWAPPQRRPRRKILLGGFTSSVGLLWPSCKIRVVGACCGCPDISLWECAKGKPGEAMWLAKGVRGCALLPFLSVFPGRRYEQAQQ